jgi:hypothetical protein
MYKLNNNWGGGHKIWLGHICILYISVIFRELSAYLLSSKSKYSFSDLVRIACLRRGGKVVSVNIKASNSIRPTFSVRNSYKLVVKKRKQPCRNGKKRNTIRTSTVWSIQRHSFTFRDLRYLLRDRNFVQFII